MNLRAAAVSLLVFAALVAAALLGAGGMAAGSVLRFAVELTKVLALIGSAAAALAFDRGDYLRRAWLFTGGCYAFLLLRDLTLLHGAGGVRGRRIEYLRSGIIVLANASALIGTVMIARAWHVAGLEPPGSALSRRSAFLIAIALAVILIGPSLVVDGRGLRHGDATSIIAVASDLADALGLCLIGPVLMTALALRGGILLWPWALFTASMVSWMFYDAASAYRRFFDPESIQNPRGRGAPPLPRLRLRLPGGPGAAVRRDAPRADRRGRRRRTPVSDAQRRPLQRSPAPATLAAGD